MATQNGDDGIYNYKRLRTCDIYVVPDKILIQIPSKHDHTLIHWEIGFGNKTNVIACQYTVSTIIYIQQTKAKSILTRWAQLQLWYRIFVCGSIGFRNHLTLKIARIREILWKDIIPEQHMFMSYWVNPVTCNWGLYVFYICHFHMVLGRL
jgi:hypothetical protein